MSADNLGSLALGGFKESCTANRMCHHCMATKEDFRKHVSKLLHICTSMMV